MVLPQALENLALPGSYLPFFALFLLSFLLVCWLVGFFLTSKFNWPSKIPQPEETPVFLECCKNWQGPPFKRYYNQIFIFSLLSLTLCSSVRHQCVPFFIQSLYGGLCKNYYFIFPTILESTIILFSYSFWFLFSSYARYFFSKIFFFCWHDLGFVLVASTFVQHPSTV